MNGDHCGERVLLGPEREAHSRAAPDDSAAETRPIRADPHQDIVGPTAAGEAPAVCDDNPDTWFHRQHDVKRWQSSVVPPRFEVRHAGNRIVTAVPVGLPNQWPAARRRLQRVGQGDAGRGFCGRRQPRARRSRLSNIEQHDGGADRDPLINRAAPGSHCRVRQRTDRHPEQPGRQAASCRARFIARVQGHIEPAPAAPGRRDAETSVSRRPRVVGSPSAQQRYDRGKFAQIEHRRRIHQDSADHRVGGPLKDGG